MFHHNVNDFAPAGYKLERSDHEDGVCKHLFVCEGKEPLTCTVTATTADEEAAALRAFHALHSAPAPAAKAKRSHA